MADLFVSILQLPALTGARVVAVEDVEAGGAEEAVSIVEEEVADVALAVDAVVDEEVLEVAVAQGEF